MIMDRDESEVACDEDLDDGVIRADSDEEGLQSCNGLDLSNTNVLTLKEQARQLVVNVRDYFVRERLNKGPLVNTEMVLERTSAALRLKSSVVARICQRWGHQRSINGKTTGGYMASHNRYHPLRIDAIKNFVEMYYRTDSTASLTKAHDKLVRSGLFRGSQNTLRRMLQKEGFDFVKKSGQRLDSFKKVEPEFIFEEYTKPNKKEEDESEIEKKLNLEPLNALQCEEEDLQFFRSVLPAVSKLNDNDKLNFRMAVMNKVQNILYEPPPELTSPSEHTPNP